jgi:putative tryptophan/tyrosine transport system substrate-binding protein
MRDAPEIERAVATFARAPNGGLIVTGNTRTYLHRDLIIRLAARHKLPAVYNQRNFVAAGGLRRCRIWGIRRHPGQSGDVG